VAAAMLTGRKPCGFMWTPWPPIPTDPLIWRPQHDTPCRSRTPETLAAQLGARTRILDFRGVEVHAFAAEEAPEVMREVGRIREKEFRAVGAGRNLALDLDDLDFGSFAYRQLVAWDPQRRELVAAYRYILCGDLVCADPEFQLTSVSHSGEHPAKP
jgi:hypothetical protein